MDIFNQSVLHTELKHWERNKRLEVEVIFLLTYRLIRMVIDTNNNPYSTFAEQVLQVIRDNFLLWISSSYVVLQYVILERNFYIE